MQTLLLTVKIQFSSTSLFLGQKIHIAFVDDAGVLKPRIQDRIKRVANNPIRQRKLRRSGGGGGRANKGAEVKLKNMSVDDLDKELEAYMSSRNAGGN